MDTRNDIATSGQQGLEPAIGYRELVEDFLASKSPNTLDAYRRDLCDFQRFLGADSGEEATRILLANGPGQANLLALRYKTSLAERGLSPRTTNRRLSALRSLVSLARRFGLVTWTLEVDGVKVRAVKDTRGPGLDAVKRILRLIDGDDPKSRRDRAIVHLAYVLGLRRGEIAGLDVSDVDIAGQVVWVRGKGKAEDEDLTLPFPTRRILADLLEVRGSTDGPLFVNFDRAGKAPGGRLSGTSIYRLVRDLGIKVGVRTWPHALRHTSITTAMRVAQESGYGLETVQDFSRHADIRTVLIYRDRERDYQGEIANLLANEIE
jgi:integrase/recombinase XerC